MNEEQKKKFAILDKVEVMAKRLKALHVEKDACLEKLTISIGCNILWPEDKEDKTKGSCVVGAPGNMRLRIERMSGECKTFKFLELPIVLQEWYAKRHELSVKDVTGKGGYSSSRKLYVPVRPSVDDDEEVA